MTDSATKTIDVNGQQYRIHSLEAAAAGRDLARLPYSLKILLENLLRCEDGDSGARDDIAALVNWQPQAAPSREIAFTPARVLMQDFTGVPAVVDLAAMRDAMQSLGGDPDRINPLSPAELVIDHSVMVDAFGTADAAEQNAAIEFQRNRERYEFLRWGQQAFANFTVVPPDTGIVHQVNLEYLARVVFTQEADGATTAYPDTVVGTDSHTTMINGLGVLGWGVGGIEAEAALLGQPSTMLIPQVVGFRLDGALPEGATATDLVLTVVEMLRKEGVVGKFVEFYGPGLDRLSLADRATIANMAPEYGATCGIFPIDQETIRYLRLSGRDEQQAALAEAYARAQGLWRDADTPAAEYSASLALDMGAVTPSLAGPKRPQDRIPLGEAAAAVRAHLAETNQGRNGGGSAAFTTPAGEQHRLQDGAVVIAAITSCTNTSNPSVMIAAGLVAQKARARGLSVKPWVKTSLAPGSLVVRDYLERAGLLEALNQLGFNIVGYGCTTCIGNSGPLPEAVGRAIREGGLAAAAVLSGNRNFEGRIHADVKMNFLASPPLVVAYAIAGVMDIDLAADPLGRDANGNEVRLADVWPSQAEINAAMDASIDANMFRGAYREIFAGDRRWTAIKPPAGKQYQWREDSTYVRKPPYFDGMSAAPPGILPIRGARVLAMLGDSVTTDHISPAGAVKADSPAGEYLQGRGVKPEDFNSYGSRRGNHEVMMRGTLANVRLRNQLAPGTEGGWTTHQPSGRQLSIYEAAMQYRQEGVPLIILAGSEYGSGSSRDWAAKGVKLLGVRAVLAVGFERIHRANLVGMGVLPLVFKPGESAASLGLTGRETYSIDGLENGAREVAVRAETEDGGAAEFTATVRVDTPKEWEYYTHGGILPYVLRQLAA